MHYKTAAAIKKIASQLRLLKTAAEQPNEQLTINAFGKEYKVPITDRFKDGSILTGKTNLGTIGNNDAEHFLFDNPNLTREQNAKDLAEANRLRHGARLKSLPPEIAKDLKKGEMAPVILDEKYDPNKTYSYEKRFPYWRLGGYSPILSPTGSPATMGLPVLSGQAAITYYNHGGTFIGVQPDPRHGTNHEGLHLSVAPVIKRHSQRPVGPSQDINKTRYPGFAALMSVAHPSDRVAAETDRKLALNAQRGDYSSLNRSYPYSSDAEFTRNARGQKNDIHKLFGKVVNTPEAVEQAWIDNGMAERLPDGSVHLTARGEQWDPTSNDTYTELNGQVVHQNEIRRQLRVNNAIRYYQSLPPAERAKIPEETRRQIEDFIRYHNQKYQEARRGRIAPIYNNYGNIPGAGRGIPS